LHAIFYYHSIGDIVLADINYIVNFTFHFHFNVVTFCLAFLL